jgi:hypothetical protein
MSPKKKLHNVIEANEDFGIIVGNASDIPSPKGRGRTALVPKLTAAKALDTALAAVSENGVGMEEEVFGVNLEAKATVKEAKNLGLKNLPVSFFTYIMKQLAHYNLKKKVEVVRRNQGKQIFLRGPRAEER